jgi:hypothetical protein
MANAGRQGWFSVRGAKKGILLHGEHVHGNTLLQNMTIPLGKEDSYSGSWISVW